MIYALAYDLIATLDEESPENQEIAIMQIKLLLKEAN